MRPSKPVKPHDASPLSCSCCGGFQVPGALVHGLGSGRLSTDCSSELISREVARAMGQPTIRACIVSKLRCGGREGCDSSTASIGPNRVGLPRAFATAANAPPLSAPFPRRTKQTDESFVRQTGEAQEQSNLASLGPLAPRCEAGWYSLRP